MGSHTINQGEIMEKITFLKASRPIRKLIVQDTAGNQTTRAAVLPKTFDVETQEVSNFKELQQAIKDHAQQGHIRIYGEPLKTQSVRRKKVNFPSKSGGYRFHILDIDKWPVLDEQGKPIPFDPANPKEFEKVTRTLLRLNGFYWLENVTFLVLVSASQRGDASLSAHLYFQFEEPVRLDEMVTVAKSVNKVKGTRLIDPQVYVSVQPDFISPPIFVTTKGQRLSDPIKTRIWISRGAKYTVDMNDWSAYKVDHYMKEIASVNNSHLYPGLSWKDIIDQYAGNPSINEPCMMAAIRMVYEEGVHEAAGKIEELARTLYHRAWAAINKYKLRGTQDDQDKYNLDKFRAYVNYPISNPIKTAAKSGAESEKIAENFEQLLKMSHRDANSLIEAFKVYQENLNDPILSYRMDSLLNEYKVRTRFVESYHKWQAKAKGEAPKDDTLNYLYQEILPMFKAVSAINSTDIYLYYYKYQKFGPISATGDMMAVIKTRLMEKFGPRNYSFMIDPIITGIQEGIPPMERERAYVWPRFGVIDDTIYYAIDAHNTRVITSDGVKNVPTEDLGVFWVNAGVKAEISDTRVSAIELRNMLESLFTLDSNDEYNDLIAALVTALYPNPVSYIIELLGAPGTGKSELADFIKIIFEPGVRRNFHRLESFRESELYLALRNNQVLVFDNIGKPLEPRVSDNLCCVVDGSGVSVRLPYESRISEMRDRRTVILTGINPVITAPDLKDRSVTLNTTGDYKHTAQDYERKKLEYLPAIRRGIMDLTSRYLRCKNLYKTKHDSRLALRAFVTSEIDGVNFASALFHKKARNIRDLIGADTGLFAFVAWLYEHDPFELPSVSVARSFYNWCIKNDNEIKTIRLNGSKYKGAVEVKDYFQKTRALGRMISKHLNYINELDGVIFRKHRKSTGVIYKLIKLDIL